MGESRHDILGAFCEAGILGGNSHRCPVFLPVKLSNISG